MDTFYDTNSDRRDDWGDEPGLMDFNTPASSGAKPQRQDAMAWVESVEANPFARDELPNDFQEPAAAASSGGFFADDADEDDDVQPVAEEDSRYPWHVGWWQTYFNVSSKDVLVRALRSMWPFTSTYFASIKTNPDLWGPFWICSTLIFFLAATGELSNYIHAYITGGAEMFQVDAAKLAIGAAVIYGYWLIIPLFLWFVCRCKAVPISLLECYCVYGYSLFIYLPISVVSVFPQGSVEWISWVLIMVAAGWSTIFLVLAFFFPLKEHWRPGLFLLIPVAAFHVGLAFAFKLYFFRFDKAGLPTTVPF